MNVRTDRQIDRQTDRPHELHVYVGLAQARPKLIVNRALLLFPACITRAINSKYYSNPYCYKLIQYVLSLILP